MSKYTFNAFLKVNKGVAGQIDRIKLNADGTAKNKSDFDELVHDITELYNNWVITDVRRCTANGMHAGKKKNSVPKTVTGLKLPSGGFVRTGQVPTPRHRSTGGTKVAVRKWVMKYRNHKAGKSWAS